MGSLIIEDQLAKEAELEKIEAEAMQKIEAEIEEWHRKGIFTRRSEHLKEMRRQQTKRARARKKAALELFNKENNIQKPMLHRKARSSVIIKKPIEAVDRFKRIEAND